jgi:methyl-accepting chemotaxis protein
MFFYEQIINMIFIHKIRLISAGILNLAKQVKTVVTEINSSAHQISGMSATLNENSQQLANGANQQVASVEEVSSTMEELASNTNQNSENAGQTQKSSLSALEGIKGVAQKGNKTIEANTMIAEEMQIINEIAFQANILALNVAVEPACAGEHGKGFAIVAAEVKNWRKKVKKLLMKY